MKIPGGIIIAENLENTDRGKETTCQNPMNVIYNYL